MSGHSCMYLYELLYMYRCMYTCVRRLCKWIVHAAAVRCVRALWMLRLHQCADVWYRYILTHTHYDTHVHTYIHSYRQDNMSGHSCVYVCINCGTSTHVFLCMYVVYVYCVCLRQCANVWYRYIHTHTHTLWYAYAHVHTLYMVPLR